MILGRMPLIHCMHLQLGPRVLGSYKCPEVATRMIDIFDEHRAKYWSSTSGSEPFPAAHLVAVLDEKNVPSKGVVDIPNLEEYERIIKLAKECL